MLLKLSINSKKNNFLSLVHNVFCYPWDFPFRVAISEGNAKFKTTNNIYNLTKKSVMYHCNPGFIHIFKHKLPEVEIGNIFFLSLICVNTHTYLKQN